MVIAATAIFWSNQCALPPVGMMPWHFGPMVYVIVSCQSMIWIFQNTSTTAAEIASCYNECGNLKSLAIPTNWE